MKDGKTYKDNWATPRSRMQMLWARVVSDGVRTMAPEICSGIYTPEETADIVGVAYDTDASTLEEAPSSEPEASAESPPDANGEICFSDTVPDASSDVASKAPEGNAMDEELSQATRDLLDILGRRGKTLDWYRKKRGVGSLKEIPRETFLRDVETLRAAEKQSAPAPAPAA